MSKQLWKARTEGQANGVLVSPGQTFTADAERNYSHWADKLNEKGEVVKPQSAGKKENEMIASPRKGERWK